MPRTTTILFHKQLSRFLTLQLPTRSKTLALYADHNWNTKIDILLCRAALRCPDRYLPRLH